MFFLSIAILCLKELSRVALCNFCYHFLFFCCLLVLLFIVFIIIIIAFVLFIIRYSLLEVALSSGPLLLLLLLLFLLLLLLLFFVIIIIIIVTNITCYCYLNIKFTIYMNNNKSIIWINSIIDKKYFKSSPGEKDHRSRQHKPSPSYKKKTFMIIRKVQSYFWTQLKQI